MKTDQMIYTLRKKKGWSQEQLAKHLGVTRQAVSKWESGQSLPDVQMILILSEVFDVSTDTLLKGDESLLEETVPEEDPPSIELDLQKAPEPAPADTASQKLYETFDFPRAEPIEPETDIRQPEEEAVLLSRSQISQYLQTGTRAALQTALGTACFTLCAAPLLAAISLSDSLGGPFTGLSGALTEEQAVGLGIALLLVAVVIGVAFCTRASFLMKPYEFIRKGEFRLGPLDEQELEVDYEQYRSRMNLWMIVGICLCVACPVPLFVMMALFGAEDGPMVFSVSLLLVIVALGVFCIVRVQLISRLYQQLLRLNEYSPRAREEEKVKSTYWSVVTLVYLAMSFISGAWGSTWLIFPLAAMVYPIIRNYLPFK